MRIAVIGAGVSGLSAARALHAQGLRVLVFEKSRGLGGRAATRRGDGVSFDHGAQYFTARDPIFRTEVQAWCERGAAGCWPARIGRFRNGQIQSSPDDQQRFVAVPGMSALGGHLGADLDIHKQTRVAPPERDGDRWVLCSDSGEQLGVFDILVVSAPAPQTRELLASVAPHFAERAASVEYTPTWAVMLAFADAGELDYDGLFFDDGVLRWAARNDSKPGREGNNWVLHAAPDWSAANLEATAAEAIADLSAAFCAATGMDASNIRAGSAHRWLYSLVPSPLDVGALWDAELQLGVCGDWCNGARIEGAYLSGHAVAGRILGHLARVVAGNEKRPVR
jgi:predicted NAD/FAD-dependent oxidoreductase